MCDHRPRPRVGAGVAIGGPRVHVRAASVDAARLDEEGGDYHGRSSSRFNSASSVGLSIVTPYMMCAATSRRKAITTSNFPGPRPAPPSPDHGRLGECAA